MNLLERTRIVAGLCTRCGRHAPYPGLLTCRPCTEKLVAPKAFEPAWRANLTARDETGRVAA